MDLLIAILATYGLTFLVLTQRGPYDMLKRWREFIARCEPVIDETDPNADWTIYNDAYDDWEMSISGQLTQLFKCQYCLGVWVALGSALIYGNVFLWPAIYGGHVFLCKVTEVKRD